MRRVASPSHLSIRLLMLVGTMSLAGCTREGPLSTDATIATRQASELIPKGTPEARVRRILAARGFTFSQLLSDTDRDHLLVGTETRGRHTWLIGVVILEGRAVACSVTVQAVP